MAHALCMLDDYGYRHAQYVTLIAVPLQRWLHERVSMFRYTYLACLVTVYRIVSPYVQVLLVIVEWK
jgi:hypothetical protein